MFVLAVRFGVAVHRDVRRAPAARLTLRCFFAPLASLGGIAAKNHLSPVRSHPLTAAKTRANALTLTV